MLIFNCKCRSWNGELVRMKTVLLFHFSSLVWNREIFCAEMMNKILYRKVNCFICYVSCWLNNFHNFPKIKQLSLLYISGYFFLNFSRGFLLAFYNWTDGGGPRTRQTFRKIRCWQDCVPFSVWIHQLSFFNQINMPVSFGARWELYLIVCSGMSYWTNIPMSHYLFEQKPTTYI